ncbi:MAG: hypothetical protein AAFR00_10650 [Pseudomonadota bacterium]
MSRTVLILSGLLGIALALASSASAQALSLDVEAVRVENVGAGWQTVNLVNTYTSPVVVCTYNLTTSANREATVRIRNPLPDSFEVRAQRFEDSSAFTASTVHCLIADEGINTLGDGRVVEARTVLSTVTAGNAVGWGSANYTNVTSQVTGGHASLVILGQVMSFNDNRASVFTSNNCSNRGTPANTSNICVTKHIGMINSTRQDETLGFIVTEPGTGTVNGVDYAFARGGNSVAGVRNSPPYQYTVSGNFETGVATMAAENGGNGGWAVLYGNDPLPNNRINLVIDEETVAGDTTRSHINEEVYYGVFRNNQTASLVASKTMTLYGAGPGAFAVPGSDVLYTITIQNLGDAPVDEDSLFLVDTLPDEVTFYNADLDDAGPETGPISFTANASGLTFDNTQDLGFSTALAAPTSMADCQDTVPAGYVPQVRHVCFSPDGLLLSGSLEPNASFSVTFRGRIN